MDFLKRFRPHIVFAVALLIFMAPLLFGRTLTNFSDTYLLSPGNHERPAGWFHSRSIDGVPAYMFNPSDLLNRDLLRAGEGFAWNPYLGFGVPWLGAMQSAPYFPGKLFSMLWPDYWRGQDLMLIVMLIIAGAGNFLLLRSMGSSASGAIFAGLAYMFCQRLFLIINMPTFTIECLLPIMLYAVNEMMKRRSVGFALFAGAIGGSQFLAGFPETSFIFGLLSGAYYLFLMAQYRGSFSAVKRGLWLGLIVAVLTLTIGGFQLAEFAKLLANSNTAHTTLYGTVVKEPFWLLPLLLPNFFGVPLHSYWIDVINPYDHMPPSLFCGISTVLLAVTALTWRSAPNRGAILFFAAVFFIFAGYEFGFPILKYVGYLPGFNMMSTAWSVFVLPFSLSVLAGFGVQSLRQGGSGTRVAMAAGLYGGALATLCLMLPSVNALAVVAALAPLLYVVPLFVMAVMLVRRLHTRVAGHHVLFGLIVLESYRCVSAFNYQHWYGPAPPPPPSLVWLKQNVGHERILGLESLMPANTLMPNRIRDIRHLDAMYPNLYVDYVEAIWPGARTDVYEMGNPKWKRFDDPLLDLAAVKYVAMPRRLDAIPPGFREVYADPAAVIYRNERAQPRARYVQKVLDGADRLSPAMLKARQDELRMGAFIDGLPPRPAATPCATSALPAVDVQEDSTDRVRMRVDAPCDGFVVLADLYFPGWQATVNGHAAPIYQANYAFRAVEVKAGHNAIVMTYSPLAWRYGAPLSALTLSGLLAAGVFFAGRHLFRRRAASA